MDYEDIVRRLCRKIGAIDAMIEREEKTTYSNEEVRKILLEILNGE